MNIKLFDYHLPQERIAQTQVKPRDHSRLLVLSVNNKKVNHKHFYDLPKLLSQNDVLVLNQTKVFPARLIGKKITGGKAEIFLIEKMSPRGRSASPRPELGTKAGGNTWQALVGAKRLKAEDIIYLSAKLEAKLVKKIDDPSHTGEAEAGKIWQIKFNQSGKKLDSLIDQIGQTPLPPYIKIKENNHRKAGSRRWREKISQDYQTVFAKNKGSVAAPTAGLHFTPKLIKQLEKKGVKIFKITLHVGWGTFAPVEVQDIKQHKLHHEWVEIDQSTATTLNKLKQQGKNIVAVGTTTARALEAFSNDKGKLFFGKKFVNIYIYSGYKFKFVDDLITNFHLPQSSLLFLVSALAGRKLILDAYQKAVKKKYRFYSFGDAMLIRKSRLTK